MFTSDVTFNRTRAIPETSAYLLVGTWQLVVKVIKQSGAGGRGHICNPLCHFSFSGHMPAILVGGPS
jgi:hypothetical protein